MSDMLLHLNILNTALGYWWDCLAYIGPPIEHLFGQTASSAYEIAGTQKDLENTDKFWGTTSSMK